MDHKPTLAEISAQSHYLTPDQSPALGFHSPGAVHNSWGQQKLRSVGDSANYSHYADILPPSPPHAHDFHTYQHYAHDRHTPLSPPSSDHGLMSPPNHPHEFHGTEETKMSVDTGSMWLPSDQHLHIPHTSARSPPPVFMDEIYRTHEVGLSSTGYLESSFDLDPMSVATQRPGRTSRADSHSSYGTARSRSRHSDTSKPRKRRQLTESTNALFTCPQENCGKYFGRVWNYNAHLMTHDPNRARAHICPYDGCRKTFVRKTDLTRHTNSVCSPPTYNCFAFLHFADGFSFQVHKKERDFNCALCGHGFARKDTLRRHEDDGCPKRATIASKSSKSRSLECQSNALSFYSETLRAHEAQQNANEYFNNGAVYPSQQASAYAAATVSSAEPGPSTLGLRGLADMAPHNPTQQQQQQQQRWGV